MIKGKWVIIAILGVAVVMGIATWPLLRIRRANEVHKTRTLIDLLVASCKEYELKHGHLPHTLAQLDPARGEPRDAWGRTFVYIPFWKYSTPPSPEWKSAFPVIRSLGPDENDPQDDLPTPGPPKSAEPPVFPSAPSSVGSSKMD
ncbi:MAG TPA: hypothetical protein VFC86_03740 [Planctomycetota bacterium]|nr:hypothetical protein [Planctomycetota bacterium]